jgi:twitching motility protein PilT
MSTELDDYIKSLIFEGVSDIHFKVFRPPLCRVHGVLHPFDAPVINQQEMADLALQILGKENWEKFSRVHEFDTSYSIPGFARFRVSVFKQRGSISIVMRIIPFEVPTLDSLLVPPVVKEIAMSGRGLILVTGITGSGKSSTLAGMINHINLNKQCHIITIEDPIEFLHRDNKASINQREIGVDTENFSRAFRAGLRQDPDIILVGELRDLETMEIALRAAETGHLVLSTVHTTDAKETVGRFIDSFPPYQQKQIRLQLAANLRAVISQRLLERADGNGRILAAEIMIINETIRELINDPEKTNEILKTMESLREQFQMQSFDQAIMDLVNEGLVSVDEGIRNATSPNDFKVKLRLGKQEG